MKDYVKEIVVETHNYHLTRGKLLTDFASSGAGSVLLRKVATCKKGQSISVIVSDDVDGDIEIYLVEETEE
ncbi:MAG: hypothetical protein HOP19_08945 [Acidobacteria bacterium]|nr:hypothetical protein [Acidobacteriota bacterium]